MRAASKQNLPRRAPERAPMVGAPSLRTGKLAVEVSNGRRRYRDAYRQPGGPVETAKVDPRTAQQIITGMRRPIQSPFTQSRQLDNRRRLMAAAGTPLDAKGRLLF